MKEKNGKKTGNRVELLFLVAVFSAPFVAAWLVYNYTNLGEGVESGNYGELIDPPLTVADSGLADPEAPKQEHRLYGKWSLIYLLSDACPAACSDRIAMLRNLRLALGSNAHRVQAVVAAVPGFLPALRDRVSERDDWAGVLLLDRNQLREAEGGSRDSNGSTQSLEPGIYLVDPLGNMMMKYKLDSKGAGILGDIKRLLRYSRIG